MSDIYSENLSPIFVLKYTAFKMLSLFYLYDDIAVENIVIFFKEKFFLGEGLKPWKIGLQAFRKMLTILKLEVLIKRTL